MTASPPLHLAQAEPGFELRFESLSRQGRGYSFHCDAHGCVDLDAMTEGSRVDYLYARAMVGRDFARPAVHPLH